MDAVCKKAHQHLYFLQKLHDFNVDSIIESVIFHLCAAMGQLILKTGTDYRALLKCGEIVGTSLNDLNNLYKARTEEGRVNYERL